MRNPTELQCLDARLRIFARIVNNNAAGGDPLRPVGAAAIVAGLCGRSSGCGHEKGDGES